MLTRRELLKCGVTAATLSGFSPRFARADNGTGKSPFTTQPFVEALPLPPVKQPVGTGPNCRAALRTIGTESSPGTHQFIERPDCAPVLAYESTVKEGLLQLPPGDPADERFGYDGQFPGPTFQARYGQPGFVRFYNQLPKSHVGFGIPSISTHLHNAHTASESDGFPGNYHGFRHLLGQPLSERPQRLLDRSPDDQRCDRGHGHHAGTTITGRTSRRRTSMPDSPASTCSTTVSTATTRRTRAACSCRAASSTSRSSSRTKCSTPDGHLVYDFFSSTAFSATRCAVNGKVQPY